MSEIIETTQNNRNINELYNSIILQIQQSNENISLTSDELEGYIERITNRPVIDGKIDIIQSIILLAYISIH